MTGDGFPKYKRKDIRNELNSYNKRINGKLVFVDKSMIVEAGVTLQMSPADVVKFYYRLIVQSIKKSSALRQYRK